MDISNLWKLDATAQAQLIRTGEVTPLEMLEAAIARIELLNPRVNAVVTPLYDSALKTARDAVLPDAPFAGVPLLVKDACLQIEGTPYYLGTGLLRDMDYRSDHTTELADRFRAAGFIVIGKTNTPEMSSGVTTEPPAFGPTRNPWDRTRTAGGSSGGSAAAVAAGMTAIAHGGDATGSLRYPAACCGVATLKPSRGRVPHVTPFGQTDARGIWTEFVLARSVRDLAGVLDAVAGQGRASAFVAPEPSRPYAQAVTAAPNRMRIGIMTRDVMAGIPTHTECVAAVEDTGRILASLGHDVEDAHPPALDGIFIRTRDAMMASVGAARTECLHWLQGVVGRPIERGEISDEYFAMTGAPASEAQMAEAFEMIGCEMREVPAWWSSGYDVLVTPTLRQPAWPLGSSGGAIDAGVFPATWSFTGQPAMSLPLRWTAEGLPVGVQLVAAWPRDDLLLQLAAQLEQASPWAHRWPPLAEAPAET